MNVYNFLAQYGLIKPETVEIVFSKFSHQRLTKFSERYLEFAFRRSLHLPDTLGATDIYPDCSAIPMPPQLIKQLSIYTRRIYIHDPILQIAAEWNAPAFRSRFTYMNPEQKDSEFKKDLSQTVRYILTLKPLIEAEIVHLVSLSTTRPEKESSIYSSDLFSPEGRIDGVQQALDLPESIAIYADEHLKCYHGTYKEGNIVPIETKPVDLSLDPLLTSDKICIQFLSDPIYWPYHMTSKMEMTGENTFRSFFDVRDGVTTNPDIFKHWVMDKKAEVTKIRFESLWNDIISTKRLEAQFLTNLPVSRDLLLLQIPDDVPVSSGSQVIKALLELNLPYFENASFESIAKARQNEASFQEFISLMDKAFGEIKNLPNDSNYKIRVQEIARDVLEQPLTRIDQRMRSLEHNIFHDNGLLIVGTLLAIVGLAATTMYAEAVVAAATGAYIGIDRIQKNRESREQIEQTPGFFYWNAVRRK